MRIKFNQNHVRGLLRDTILELNTRYNKSGETEFVIEDTDFSGKQLLAMAQEGVELSEGMRTFIQAPVGFLEQPYGEGTMRSYLSQHMTIETPEYELCLLAAPEHFTGSQLLEFAQYGDILNMNEYQMLVEHGAYVHTIASIDRDWSTYFSDYKQARKKMQELVATTGFENLTPDEQRIAATWFATSAENIDLVLPVDAQLRAGYVFDANSRASREQRYKTVFNDFRGLLSTPDAMKVMQVVKQNDLYSMYVENGFEGAGAVNYKGDADFPSILDFLNSTPGTPYETTGLASLGLVPLKGKSVNDLRERATDVILNGNY